MKSSEEGLFFNFLVLRLIVFGREAWYQAKFATKPIPIKNHGMVACDGVFSGYTRYIREGCRAKSQLRNY